MKKGLYILSSILIIILLSNLPPIKYFFNWIVDETHYEYASASGNFKVIDRSGNNITAIKKGFKESLKKENLITEDTILYRLFWKNPAAFWRYRSYFDKNDERYKLPYKSKEDIEKKKNNIQNNPNSEEK